MSHSLLIVEDDDATAGFLVDNLVADGFRVAHAETGGEALRQMDVRPPALVLLDLGLPDGSGLSVLDRIRAADGRASRIDPQLPVIVISGRAGETDRVRSFERGADDHVVKPLSYGELRARVQAVLRRCDGRRRRGVIRCAELTLDPVTRAVRVGETLVAVSTIEFALLHRLAEDPDRVFAKEELLRDVWGYRAPGRTRTVDTHACRLRRKLETASPRRWIVNVRGVGYRLMEPE